jgi:hypothetical protein
MNLVLFGLISGAFVWPCVVAFALLELALIGGYCGARGNGNGGLLTGIGAAAVLFGGAHLLGIPLGAAVFPSWWAVSKYVGIGTAYALTIRPAWSAVRYARGDFRDEMFEEKRRWERSEKTMSWAEVRTDLIKKRVSSGIRDYGSDLFFIVLFWPLDALYFFFGTIVRDVLDGLWDFIKNFMSRAYTKVLNYFTRDI